MLALYLIYHLFRKACGLLMFASIFCWCLVFFSMILFLDWAGTEPT